jgi:DNA-binding transcriptional regulator LsrR (DeoR family)
VAPRADPAHRPSGLVQAAAIARRYYLDGRTKLEIADEFGLSRFKVARILDEARASGLVHIEITLPAQPDAALAAAVRNRYRLNHVIVLRTAEEAEASLRTHLGVAAADLLADIATDADVLGIGSGRTMSAVTAALTTLPRCSIVQLSGVLTAGGDLDGSVELARRAAAVTGGRLFPIYAPLIVADAATKAALTQQREVAETLAHQHLVTKALVAIGSWDPPNSILHDALDPPTRRRLIKLGVRADICGILLDEHGAVVPTDLGERLLSITDTELRQVPEVIAVAAGGNKADAARAVVLGGYATSLVVDTAIAEYLIDNPPADGWHPRVRGGKSPGSATGEQRRRPGSGRVSAQTDRGADGRVRRKPAVHSGGQGR